MLLSEQVIFYLVCSVFINRIFWDASGLSGTSENFLKKVLTEIRLIVYLRLTMKLTEDKLKNFSEDEIALARYARVLSHPARLAILRILAQKQACICGDIVLELPLAQSTVSEHLRELKAAGLVRGEVDGPSTCYCLDYGNLKNLFKSISKFGNQVAKGIFDEKCC